jgi:hypothetical protein
MKTLVFASLASLFAATAAAGEVAVPARTLEGVGLATMQQLSNADGLAIRGKGPFDNRFFFNGAARPTLTSSFGSRFGFQSLGGMDPPGNTPGGNPPAGNTPPSGNTTSPGLPGFGGFTGLNGLFSF